MTALAGYLAHMPDELRADFQQFYGLNLDGLGTDYTVSHAAALAVQLPQSARVKSAGLDGLTILEALLNLIEWDCRIAWWQNTKEAQHDGAATPEPVLPLPGAPRRKKKLSLDVVKRRLKMRRKEVQSDG